MKKEVTSNVLRWMESNIDADVKSQIINMLKNDEQLLIDSFYKNLEFGTGGLRGKMGIGSNRINIYTIGLVTQGLSNYLKKNFNNNKEIRVVIAYDSRNNSKLFAETTANVLSSNNIKVFLFNSLRPTPELSFAIRHLNTQAGIVITASHNPKEYNGYKVYWENGSQIVSPHDKGIIAEVETISIDDIKFTSNPSKINMIGEDIDSLYLAQLRNLSINPEIINSQKDLKIVYTPLHGTGITLMPDALKNYGFQNINLVQEQMQADGNFPTVKSPNPENKDALELSIKKAQSIEADIILATDPDADRVGVVVKNKSGKYIALNGNQTGSILAHYILSNLSNKNLLKENSYFVKTIVTTNLIKHIADKYNVKTYEVLTGFKYIAEAIETHQGEKFLGGFEESYGYLFSDIVRDKDAIMSGVLICEAAAWAKEQGKTLDDILTDLYLEHGYNYDILVNLVKEGNQGADAIHQIINGFREDSPCLINDVNVVIIRDYLSGIESNLFNGEQRKITLPKSNVIQFILEDSTRITIRPSGTEPKIKFYINYKTDLKSAKDIASVEEKSAEIVGKYKQFLTSN